MSPLPPLNEEKPLSGVLSLPKQHQDTMVHKYLLFSIIHLVKLRGFVPHRQAQCITLWRKKTFRSGLIVQMFIYSNAQKLRV